MVLRMEAAISAMASICSSWSLSPGIKVAISTWARAAASHGVYYRRQSALAQLFVKVIGKGFDIDVKSVDKGQELI